MTDLSLTSFIPYINLCIQQKMKAGKCGIFWKHSQSQHKKHTHHHPRRCRLHRHQNPSSVFSTDGRNHFIKNKDKSLWDKFPLKGESSSVAKWVQRTHGGSYQWRLLLRHQACRPLHRWRIVLLFFILWILHTYKANTGCWYCRVMDSVQLRFTWTALVWTS